MHILDKWRYHMFGLRYPLLFSCRVGYIRPLVSNIIFLSAFYVLRFAGL